MSHLPLLVGLETKVRLIVGSGPHLPSDPEKDAIDFVRCALQPGVWMRWAHAREADSQDMRGFPVELKRLDGEGDEDSLAPIGWPRKRSSVPANDLVLTNGARLYSHGVYPEYCTPECASLDDLVAQDRAGDRILMSCGHQFSRQRETGIAIYKNNTDYTGQSFGSHESYLLPRSLKWTAIMQGLTAFLVTRQIFVGAGKYATEAEGHRLSETFQLSQQSDFVTELENWEADRLRPLVHTLDVPHADRARYRRVHLTVGDSNMMPMALRLRVGTTALVLEALACDPEATIPKLADPLMALVAVSRDSAFRWELDMQNRKAATAISVQRDFLAMVRARCDLSSGNRRQLVDDWERVLTDLEADYTLCADRLDWVAKLLKIRRVQEQEGLGHSDPRLRELDLEYHRLDPCCGLYYQLEQKGKVAGIPSDLSVAQAITTAPPTRAAVRGGCLAKFTDAVEQIHWSELRLRTTQGAWTLSLNNLFERAEIDRHLQAIGQAKSVDQLRSLLEA